MYAINARGEVVFIAKRSESVAVEIKGDVK
jgi:hypothetical protein